jgi:hypothetical protein
MWVTGKRKGRYRIHNTPKDCPFYDDNIKKLGGTSQETKIISVDAIPEDVTTGVEEPVTTEAKAPTTEVTTPVAGKVIIKRTQGQTVRSSIQPSVAIEPKKEEVKFVIDSTHTKTFYNDLIYPAIRYGTHLADDWLEIKYIDDKYFTLNNFALSQIRDDNPNNLYARGATAVLKVLGAKTKESAEGMIDDASFLMVFGELLGVVALHYVKGIKESPKLKRRKEEKKLKLEAKKNKTVEGEFTKVP